MATKQTAKQINEWNSIAYQTRDGSFKESEHPRAASGEFTSGGASALNPVKSTTHKGSLSIKGGLRGKPAGELTFVLRGAKADLQNVEVLPNARRKGVAESMYRKLREVLEENNVATLRGDVESAAPVKLREKVFGAGNTVYLRGAIDDEEPGEYSVSAAEALKLFEGDDFDDRVVAVTLIKKVKT